MPVNNLLLVVFVSFVKVYFVVGANDACLGSGIRIKQPFSANRIGDLLQAFKNLLTSNYPAACLTPGGTVMSLGYQRISQAGGSCPVVLLTRDTETSKTTVLKACISLTGNSEMKGRVQVLKSFFKQILRTYFQQGYVNAAILENEYFEFHLH